MSADCVIISNIDMLREDKRRRINVFSSAKYAGYLFLDALKKHRFNIWNVTQQMRTIYKVRQAVSEQNSMLVGEERKDWNCIDLINYVRAGGNTPGANPSAAGNCLTWFKDVTLNGSFLYSYLERRDVSCELVQTFDCEPAERLEKIFAEHPKVAVISTSFITPDLMLAVKEVFDYIKRISPNTTVVLGSWALWYNITYYPEFIKIILDCCDYVVYEPRGHNTLFELIKALRENKDPGRLGNLIYRRRGKVVFTLPVADKTSINDEPIDWQTIIEKHHPRRVRVMTSQGCPFTCRFCSFREHPLEYKDIEVLRRELCSIKAAGCDRIDFVDDLFCHPEARLTKICRMMIEERFGFKWFCLSRASGLKESTIALMAEAGCELVNIGMESADATVLANIDKRTDVALVYRQMEHFRKYGMHVFCDFFLGFPGETDESVQNTLNFLNRACIDSYSLFLFIVQRGTLIDSLEMRKRFNLKGEYIAWSHNTGTSLETARKMSDFVTGVNDDILRVRGLEDIHMLIDDGYSAGELRTLAGLVKILYLLGAKAAPNRRDEATSHSILQRIEGLEHAHSTDKSITEALLCKERNCGYLCNRA